MSDERHDDPEEMVWQPEDERRTLPTDLVFGFCLAASHRAATLEVVVTTRAEVIEPLEAEKRVLDYLDADRLFRQAQGLLEKDLHERYGGAEQAKRGKQTRYSYAAESTGRIGRGSYASPSAAAAHRPSPGARLVAVEIDGDIHEPRELNDEEKASFERALETLESRT